MSEFQQLKNGPAQCINQIRAIIAEAKARGQNEEQIFVKLMTGVALHPSAVMVFLEFRRV